jgi:hypothetical protein
MSFYSHLNDESPPSTFTAPSPDVTLPPPPLRPAGLRHNISQTSLAAVNEIKASVHHLLTSTSLNQVFSTRYRRQAFFALVAYLFVGLSYYCLQQGFTFLDSLYFITITILAIGYGDYVPHSSSQRLFTCFFIVFGVVIVSACIGSVTEVLYDFHETAVHERVKKAAIKMQSVGKINKSVADFLDVSQRFACHLALFSDLPVDRRKSIQRPSESESRVSSTSTESIATMFRQSFDSFGLFGARLTEEEEQAEEKMVDAMQKLNMDMFDEELQVSPFTPSS